MGPLQTGCGHSASIAQRPVSIGADLDSNSRCAEREVLVAWKLSNTRNVRSAVPLRASSHREGESIPLRSWTRCFVSLAPTAQAFLDGIESKSRGAGLEEYGGAYLPQKFPTAPFLGGGLHKARKIVISAS